MAGYAASVFAGLHAGDDFYDGIGIHGPTRYACRTLLSGYGWHLPAAVGVFCCLVTKTLGRNAGDARVPVFPFADELDTALVSCYPIARSCIESHHAFPTFRIPVAAGSSCHSL